MWRHFLPNRPLIPTKPKTLSRQKISGHFTRRTKLVLLPGSWTRHVTKTLFCKTKYFYIFWQLFVAQQCTENALLRFHCNNASAKTSHCYVNLVFICIHSMPTSSLRNAYVCLWTCLLGISERSMYICYKLYELGCSFLSETGFSCLVSKFPYLLALECYACCITCHLSDIPSKLELTEKQCNIVVSNASKMSRSDMPCENRRGVKP